MNKSILIALSLSIGLMFSCSNEDINIPQSEEQPLNEKVLSIEEASTLLKGFIADVHTVTAIPEVLRSYGLGAGSFTAYSIEKCIQSLQNGYPILFMAQSSEGGHAWICDAWKRHIYDSSTYYDYLDMNWGWSGLSNGFFSIMILYHFLRTKPHSTVISRY